MNQHEGNATDREFSDGVKNSIPRHGDRLPAVISPPTIASLRIRNRHIRLSASLFGKAEMMAANEDIDRPVNLIRWRFERLENGAPADSVAQTSHWFPHVFTDF
jgi:hypothetical protein